MSRNWHELFGTWSKPPSETEEKKGSTAATTINDALRSYPALQSRKFEVYSTGSYRNNTNVRLDSDIDVAVVLKDAVFCDYPASGLPTRELLGFTNAAYGFTEFRNDVGNALALKFGSEGVTPADKTFNVHESSRRLDADVTAFCEYRCYTGRTNADGTWHYDTGAETRSRTDPRKRIINWHLQHYENGVKRNEATHRRFKRIVRILKRLRNDMRSAGSDHAMAAAEPVPSFLIECLVFNAPDGCFNREDGSYYQDLREVVLQLWSATKQDSTCSTYVEVSKMKDLFGPNQPWTRADANEFLLRAWHHVGFK